jgi:hypothetical protein
MRSNFLGPKLSVPLGRKLGLGTHFLEALLRANWRCVFVDGEAKQSFAEFRFQAGAWERGGRAMRLCRAGLELALVTVIAASAAGPAQAQEATLVKSAVKEVLEILGTQAEKEGAKTVGRELAEFGGEAAVRQTMEQVARETGEEGVVNVVRLSKSYGIDAMKAAKVAPKLTANFIDRVSPEFAPGALRALARPEERAVLAKLDSELVPGALEAAARHPGVGAEVVDKLGVAGVRASQRFDTDAMIQLARSPDAARVAALPAAQRKGLISAMTNFIEQHPKTVLGAAGLGLFVTYKDDILGGKGEIVLGPDGKPMYVPATGIAERVTNRTLVWVLPVVAAIVGLWGASKLYWSWRWSKLSHAVKTAGITESQLNTKQS